MSSAGIGAFTSEKTKQRFLTVYDKVAGRQWPAGIDVPTSFGVTRAYRTSGDGVPLVLLPGAGGNALAWPAPLRAAAGRPVIAIDPVGEPGRSTQERPLGDGDDWVAWLDETLDGLGEPRVHLVGVSFGGWVALRYALGPAHRAQSITLLDPAGFGAINGRFLAWIVLGGLAGFAPAPLRRAAARALRNATLLDDELMRLVRVSTGFRRRHPAPSVLTDDDLSRLTVPLQILLGGRSQMYDSAAVAARLSRVAPRVVTEVLPEAGHDLPVRLPGPVSDRILRFVQAAETPAP